MAAPRIHHLNCGTMCPRGRRFLAGEGGLFESTRLVCHVLLIEHDGSLTLVDTGFGSHDVNNRGQLGRPFLAVVRPQLILGETASARVAELGLDPGEVRHIVLTHMDLDHAGGLPDFPNAEVHVFAGEHRAAMHPTLRERSRYIPAQWAHGPRWVPHTFTGEDWFGFETVRPMPGGGDEILMIPLAGHTRGHTGVAVRWGSGWLLHCGDAYFHRSEVATPPSCPLGLQVFETLNQADGKLRHANQERLRELADRHHGEVELICAHDPVLLDQAQARAGHDA